ncbi:MAG: L,D-transpeptidase family protein [Marinobacterium sp.]|nr:L,D-transpeptidase family protein [Marinobacterium sp.]
MAFDPQAALKSQASLKSQAPLKSQVTLKHPVTIEGAIAASLLQQTAITAHYQPVINHYQQLANHSPWPALRRKVLIRPGQHHTEIVEIRWRLALLGDYTGLSPRLRDSTYYDVRLAKAVQRFQRRHGLKVDAIIGPNTRRALNISPIQRLQQLTLNKQRLIQFAQQAPAEYLLVNIPAFHLYHVIDGQAVLDMKAIVGRHDRQTPRLQSALSTLVVHPDWNVPKGIAYKDVVPELKEDLQALTRKGLELVQGYGPKPQRLSVAQLDWQRLYLGAPNQQQRFWQRPGRHNPLGQLKFTFPNRHTVYMHGTPEQNLFNESIRTFSSGCIRVEHPQLLAEGLLSGAQHWPEGRLSDLLRQSRTRHFRLPRQVPIFLTYWTAWVVNGEAQFRFDIYKQDNL